MRSSFANLAYFAGNIFGGKKGILFFSGKMCKIINILGHRMQIKNADRTLGIKAHNCFLLKPITWFWTMKLNLESRKFHWKEKSIRIKKNKKLFFTSCLTWKKKKAPWNMLQKSQGSFFYRKKRIPWFFCNCFLIQVNSRQSFYKQNTVDMHTVDSMLGHGGGGCTPAVHRLCPNMLASPQITNPYQAQLPYSFSGASAVR